MSINWQRSDPVPALIVHPPGAASLDEAHAAIEQWEYYSGRVLDSAQRLSVEHMMAETASGHWAARTTARAEARQNGKGDEVEVVESWGITQRGEAIVHSAHEIPTSRSAHLRMVALLDSHKDLRRRKKKVLYGDGKQEIETNGDGGGIIAYRTRTKGGGRGLDDISRLVVDEAQHAQSEQLASSTPILAVNPNPQTNFLGSAGIAGKSVWWWEMRLRGMRPDDAGSFAYLEHSSEIIRLVDGLVESSAPDADDRKAWKRANPAYPDRITPDFLAEQLRILGPDLYLREHGGVWDPQPEGPAHDTAIDETDWTAGYDRKSSMVGKIVLAPDTGFDLDRASIGAAGRRADGHTHVELVETGPGTSWIEMRLDTLLDSHDVAAVAIDATGPAKVLTPMVKRLCDDHDVKFVSLSGSAYQAGCADLVRAVKAIEVFHGADALLSSTATKARKRRIGDGWLWDRRHGDISPVGAVTAAFAALGGVDTEQRRSAYEDDGLMTV